MEAMETLSDSWDGRRVLVTGATGFIGSWLVKELLALKADIVALVSDLNPQSEVYRSGAINRATVVYGKLEDFWLLTRAVNEHQIDAVFHLGAQSLVGPARRFPMLTLETNVRGTYNLLEACRISDTVSRVVIASSDKAYGEQSHLPYTEEMPLQGRSPYEVSKSCADLIAQAYHYTYSLPVGIVRCGNVYGGGDLNWNRIIPGTVRSLLRGQRPIIRSDGTYVRDYLYVKDAVRAYLRLAESLDDPQITGKAFNFSTESPMSVLDVVSMTQKLMGREDLAPEIRNSANGEIKIQHLSAERARNVLRWRPAYDLESGLRETIAWYKALG